MLQDNAMAFFCPSQLSLKKKALPDKKPYPPDTYRPSTHGGGKGTLVYPTITKSAMKNGSTTNHRHEKRTVRIKESGFKQESLIERKIRTASFAKPANIRVKVTKSYEPTDKEELRVRKGHFVKILFQQGDWAYVVDSSSNEGFIPSSCCSIINASIDSNSKSSTSGYEDSFEESDDGAGEGTTIPGDPHFPRKERTESNSVTYFPKRACGPQLMVLFDYAAKDENDVSVCRGEIVMLLNDQDQEWVWITTEDGEEGFVPRTFVVSHVCEACSQRLSLTNVAAQTSTSVNSSDVTPTSSCSIGGKSTSSYRDLAPPARSERTASLKGSRLIVLHNFESKSFDDLTVLPGEYVYANLKDQLIPGWIWAYSPKSHKSGFIPEDRVKEPVVTDI